MKAFLRVLLAALSAALLLCGCAGDTGTLYDGYYTAEAAEFDNYGWKEYVTVCISNRRIVSVEYDARNASGFIKSWDMDYMRVMNETDGTYPNEYVRKYAERLVDKQHPERVDAVTGATHSHASFQLLAAACLEQANTNGSNIVYVTIPDYVATPVAQAGSDTP